MSEERKPATSTYARRLDDLLRRDELAAFENGGPVSDRARFIAREVAEALGFCRLTGVRFTGELAEFNDADLLPSLAAAAAGALVETIERAAAALDHLPARFDAAAGQMEVDALLADPLIIRMRAHAAFVAIDEAYLAALESSAPDLPVLRDTLDALLDRLEAYDAALREHLDLLSLVIETNLLNNWRAMLAAEHADRLPWWLDGTLEAAAAQSRGEALASLPTAEWWEKVRGNDREVIQPSGPRSTYFPQVAPGISR